MERGGRSRGRKSTKNPAKQPELPDDGGDMSDTGDEDESMVTGAVEMLRAGLKDIVKEISDFRTEMKSELAKLKEEMKKEIKEELEDFKRDINQKLADTGKELTTQTVRIAEAEQRIEETENWNAEVKDVLLQTLKQQKIFQERLTDQEGRNRRNNLRIFGLEEGAEGSSASQFIEQLLKKELALPAEMDLQIQRAHRALVPKPDSSKPPRSIVVNFLQYTTKETVLREAWKKKPQHNNRALFFDQDYATEIIQKRKEYAGIKKVLKERGIRFQTPMARMRIHWDTGPKTYETAREAAKDLSERGIETTPVAGRGAPGAGMEGRPTERGTPPAETEERLKRAWPWQRVGNKEDTATRAKQKLQKYRGMDK